MKRVLLALLASAALSISPARAQQSQTSPAASPSPEAPESDVVKRAETVTVASKIEQAVIDAPVAIGVITARATSTSPPARARPRCPTASLPSWTAGRSTSTSSG